MTYTHDITIETSAPLSAVDIEAVRRLHSAYRITCVPLPPRAGRNFAAVCLMGDSAPTAAAVAAVVAKLPRAVGSKVLHPLALAPAAKGV